MRLSNLFKTSPNKVFLILLLILISSCARQGRGPVVKKGEIPPAISSSSLSLEKIKTIRGRASGYVRAKGRKTGFELAFAYIAPDVVFLDFFDRAGGSYSTFFSKGGGTSLPNLPWKACEFASRIIGAEPECASHPTDAPHTYIEEKDGGISILEYRDDRPFIKTTYSNYKERGGIDYPSHIEISTLKGKRFTISLDIGEIEFNKNFEIKESGTDEKAPVQNSCLDPALCL